MKEQLLSTIIGNHSNGYVVLNEKLEVVFSNKKMREVTKYEQGLFGNFMNCINAQDNNRCGQSADGCRRCLFRKNLLKILADKQEKWLGNVPFRQSDKVIYFDCLMEYVDGYICIEFFNLVQENPNLFVLEKVLDHTNDFIFYKDSSLVYRYANQGYANFFGLDKNDILSKTDADLLPQIVYEECLESDYATLENGEVTTYVEVNGFVFQVSKTRIQNGILGIAKDVTKEYEFGKLVYIDELTGLPNRRKYIKDVSNIYEKEIESYYLALVDLDDLREINNQFGHQTGDLYLKTLADVLASSTNGTFYRLGGDEFVALIQGTQGNVEQTLQSIYKKLQEVDLTPKITITTGVKKIDINIGYYETYEMTDKLLYEAKHAGKNRFYINSAK